MSEVERINLADDGDGWRSVLKSTLGDHSPVSVSFLFQILDEVLDAFKDAQARIARLQAKVAALEARGELKYCGVWQEQEYTRGNFVTCDGGMWHAEMKTSSRPGKDATWRLAVKSGGR